jgi:hypothetical protein
VRPEEELELRGLVGLAWERRADPAELRAAVARIMDWHDRRDVRAYERHQQSSAAVLHVLRQTDPTRTRRSAA